METRLSFQFVFLLLLFLNFRSALVTQNSFLCDHFADEIYWEAKQASCASDIVKLRLLLISPPNGNPFLPQQSIRCSLSLWWGFQCHLALNLCHFFTSSAPNNFLATDVAIRIYYREQNTRQRAKRGPDNGKLFLILACSFRFQRRVLY